MTQKSIEQREKELEAARAAYRAAKKQLIKAKSNLHADILVEAEREFAARGIVVGAKVVAATPSGTRVRGIYDGHEMLLSTPVPRVRKIKKDGTAHATATIYTSWDAVWEAAT